MTYLIDVTREDIEDGERDSCTSCPVAIAIQRATGKVASVDYGRLELPGCATIRLPDFVEKFTLDFDSGAPVEPFSFLIDLESEE